MFSLARSSGGGSTPSILLILPGAPRKGSLDIKALNDPIFFVGHSTTPGKTSLLSMAPGQAKL